MLKFSSNICCFSKPLISTRELVWWLLFLLRLRSWYSINRTVCFRSVKWIEGRFMKDFLTFHVLCSQEIYTWAITVAVTSHILIVHSFIALWTTTQCNNKYRELSNQNGSIPKDHHTSLIELFQPAPDAVLNSACHDAGNHSNPTAIILSLCVINQFGWTQSFGYLPLQSFLKVGQTDFSKQMP